jgi:hypothetical protein
VAAPQPPPEVRETLEQQPRRDLLDGICNSNGRRDADEQMDVVRLDLLGDHRPTKLSRLLKYPVLGRP